MNDMPKYDNKASCWLGKIVYSVRYSKESTAPRHNRAKGMLLLGKVHSMKVNRRVFLASASDIRFHGPERLDDVDQE